MKNQVYQETQAFSQKWVFGVLAAVLIVLIAGYVCQTQYHVTFGNNPMNNKSYITCIILVAVPMIVFYFARLKTRIDDDGISYKFPPFQFTFKLYSWTDLDKVYVRSFSPLGEYGGWGYRISPNGTAIAVTGVNGIQLITKTGKSILIGTSNPQTAAEAIKNYFKQAEKTVVP